MAINFTGEDHSDKFKQLIAQTQDNVLVCGMPVKNDKLQMIAIVQEQGRHIEAKNYPYLVIPTKNAAGRKTSEIAGLYQRGHALGINDPSQPNGFLIMFVLKKSIDIPPRPFMRITYNHHINEWAQLFVQSLVKVAILDGSVDDVFKAVGKQMVSDMQDTLDKLSQPANAPLTSDRKGFNDPLVDTKLMRNSIDWMVFNKE